jgi:hypothetical protein
VAYQNLALLFATRQECSAPAAIGIGRCENVDEPRSQFEPAPVDRSLSRATRMSSIARRSDSTSGGSLPGTPAVLARVLNGY